MVRKTYTRGARSERVERTTLSCAVALSTPRAVNARSVPLVTRYTSTRAITVQRKFGRVRLLSKSRCSTR
ncbi:hypothetical protein LSTR_LSTR005283 [Laodelphax striatellus]|uniref:Uncharacterized protein n=1 Tax=Laodelphax striatellus TaxID=195883 RepID=A0A482X937_LAOST|nr:hypothetical protein LSTR_LSTR005283 [Laodelphax striatellus]